MSLRSVLVLGFEVVKFGEMPTDYSLWTHSHRIDQHPFSLATWIYLDSTRSDLVVFSMAVHSNLSLDRTIQPTVRIRYGGKTSLVDTTCSAMCQLPAGTISRRTISRLITGFTQWRASKIVTTSAGAYF